MSRELLALGNREMMGCLGEANPIFASLFQHGHMMDIIPFCNNWGLIFREPESAGRTSAFGPRDSQTSITTEPPPAFRSR